MLKLALKLFPRMLRSNAFALLLASLVVACGTITAVSLFIERIDNTLNQEAASFIAADAKIIGSLPPREEWFNAIEKSGLKTANFLGFRAMTFSDSSMSLTQVKAVDDHYPLKGTLELIKNSSESAQESQQGPKPGYAWIAPRLFSLLNIKAGDKIKVGNAEFIVEAKIIQEPDSTQNMFGIEPRVMIHLDDVPATEAVQTGSRINHALLLAGEKEALRTLREELTPQLGEHHRWINPENGNRAFSSAFDRAQQFLRLSGGLSVILAAVAIALAAHRFSVTQQTQVALLKTLGVASKRIQNLYLALLGALGVLGFVLGSLAGWILHHGVLILLGDLVPADLAPAGTSSFIFGLLTTIIMLFAFAAPPLLSLRKISPTHILRTEAGKHRATLATAILGIFSTALLIYIYSSDIKVTFIIFACLCLCILISFVISHFLFAFLSRLQSSLRSYTRLGIANIKRQKTFTALQVFIFSCVAFLLSVLFQVRTNLLENWEPLIDETPNHFIFNIYDDDLDSIKTFLTENNISMGEFYPMSRGRLIEIGDTEIKDRIDRKKSRNNYRRELNLTWSKTLGKDNKILEGAWFGDSNEMQVSAEEEYASGLGLKIGETLRFSIAGREVQATLASIRSVEWDSMNPNFFMIFNQAIADDFAANWITSFYLHQDDKQLLNTLATQYPTITIMELDQTLNLVKNIVSRVSMAVEFILILVAMASILVLLTGIYSTLDERLRESALLRSFGAKRSFVQRVLLVEFSTIGIIAGLFASIAAEVCLYYIQTDLFNSTYSPNLVMWLVTPLLSMLIISTIGYWATVNTTHVPPAQSLRRHD